jgi:predicted MPP superfamily phosphohydrolase
MSWVASLLLTVVLLWVAYRWAVDSFPWLARRRRWLAGGLAGLVLTQLTTRWMVVHWHTAGLAHTGSLVLLMAIGMAAIPIALMRGASWVLARRARREPPAPPPVTLSGGAPAPPAPALTRRQLVEATGGVVLLGASGSVLGWGIVRGRHEFELREVPVRIAGLPRVLDGYTIAQVSDLHTGELVGERDLDDGLALVRRARPDLVVATGDLVDFDPEFAPLVASKLAALGARDGVYAILGNHDYYTGADRVLAALRAAGVGALVDDGRVLRAGDGGGFALLGVDDRWSTHYGRPGPRLDRALAAVPPGLPRILLSHQPPTVDDWAGQVALQLSGHTHGGQINPGFRPADLFLPYVAGVYEVGGTTLYVNRGFGTVGPPSRVGAPPEVTRIVLVAA